MIIVEPVNKNTHTAFCRSCAKRSEESPEKFYDVTIEHPGDTRQLYFALCETCTPEMCRGLEQ